MSVGAVLVRDNRVISTGYNGTPEGWDNCTDGGACPRCDDREGFGGSGNGYDKCICVHAEMNAIAAAARYGMPIDGCVAYVTNEPCLTCAKELVQAGVVGVYYSIPAPPITQPKGRAQRKHLEETRTRFLGQLNARQVKFRQVKDGLFRAIAAFESD